MNKIYYAIPTYKSFDHCAKAIDSVLQGTLVPDDIIIIDNSGHGHALPYLSKFQNNQRITIWPQTRNLGVAASWNLMLSQLDDGYCIIANDDVFVHPNTIQSLVDAADDSDEWFFYGNNTSGNAFSLFLLKQEGFQSIGPFDEWFYPAYFEDNDYSWRLRKAGHNLISVPNATYDHIGSSTLKRYTAIEQEAHHRAFRANREYYVQKWGGEPGHETR